MPIIAKVGRSSPRIRVMMGLIYAFLIAGGLVVVYPFLLLLSHSISSETDQYDYRIIPQYLYNTAALYRKNVADRYGHRFINNYNRRYGTLYEKYRNLPAVTDINTNFVAVWRDFKYNRIPRTMQQPAYTFEYVRKFISPVNRQFRKYELKKYGSLAGINKAFGHNHITLNTVDIFHEDLLNVTWFPENAARYNDWQELKKDLDPRLLYAVNGEGAWQFYLAKQYHSKISNLNHEYGTSYGTFSEIPLREETPENTAAARDRETFIRTRWPVRFIEALPAALPGFRHFVQKRYGTITAYNAANESNLRNFNEISIPEDMHTYRAATRLDWRDYIRTTVDLNHIRCVTSERLFRRYLLEKHGNIQQINSELHTSFKDYYDIRPPWLQTDWTDVTDNTAKLKAYYLVRNYREIIEYIIGHGRSLLVTIVFVGTVILAQLIINPMCAYALSRFNLRYSNQIVLFLLATMAFPVEVTMIPNFLFMRELGILNSYWALILPALANGYFIFILKGYFDSMPAELYEAADLDGAGETAIYFNIVAPQVRPILAWMTMQTFMVAYGAFMFAMILCQDSRMWTLMVWIYEMQLWAPSYLISAGLVVAAIPSLLVFIVCQRIIMRSTGLPASL